MELALEAGAPFALEQLYYGFVSTPAGDSALLFATHRRIFAGQDWAEAAAVLPAFLPLVMNPPAGPRRRFWSHESVLTLAVWDGSNPFPVLVLSRRAGDGDATGLRSILLAEAAARLGEEKGEAEDYTGQTGVHHLRQDRGWEFVLKGADGTPDLSSRCEIPALATADVRDRAVLRVQRQRQRRGRLLWRGFALSAAVLVLAALLELTVFAGGRLLVRQRVALAQQAAVVEKIEAAQALGARIEELAQRRFRPFEMLAVINESRPASVQFVRSTSRDHDTLEIEAQARDAASVGAYESSLRAHAALERVEIRDMRLRDGLTTFQLTAVFKPDALGGAGGRP